MPSVLFVKHYHVTKNRISLGAWFLGVNLGSLSTTNSILHFKLHDNDIVEKRLQLKFLKVKGYSPQSKYRIACFS